MPCKIITRLLVAVMRSLRRAAHGENEDLFILWQSTSIRKRKVSSVGREMYKVRWQKLFGNNLHSSDQKSVQPQR